tara:strand:+ start:384 stop:791 length:408 start_codon:yes stop_codon:yes gene_type:complete
MLIKLLTVIDITQTNVARDADKKLLHQQANYNTVLNTCLLRVNIEPISVVSKVIYVDNLGFGINIQGKQRVWEMLFDNPYEGALTVDMLKDDFDLVPVIIGLDETALINNNAFRTKDKVETNIIFIDNEAQTGTE